MTKFSCLFDFLVSVLAAVALHAAPPIALKVQVDPIVIRPGQDFTLGVTLAIAEPWHIYGRTGGDSGQIPLGLALSLPADIKEVGSWEWPLPQTQSLGKPIDSYRGTQVFRQRLHATQEMSGGSIKVTVAYQACTDELCGPPEKIVLVQDLSLGQPTGKTAADQAWAEIEQEYPLIKPGLNERSPDHPYRMPATFYQEFVDAHAFRMAALTAAFFDNYPHDSRRWTALALFVNDQETMPVFVGKITDRARLDQLWDYQNPQNRNQSREQTVRQEVQFRRALPRDAERQAKWLRQGDDMVARWVADPTTTVDQKEDGEFMRFGRDMRLAGWHFHQLQEKVDWSPFLPRFLAHVEKYSTLNVLGARAEDYLGAVQLADPAAAKEGWSELLKFTSGANVEPGLAAIQKLAERHLRALSIVDMKQRIEAIKFTATDGTRVELGAMHGKVVLIDFWATWCTPCVEELPNLKAVYAKYKDQGFEIVSISGDSGSREGFMKFVQDHGCTWPQCFDGKGTNTEFAQLFEVKGWPTSYLVDADGKVAATNLRGAKLESAVRRFLGLE